MTVEPIYDKRGRFKDIKERKENYAEWIVADLWRANTATHEERVAIISAALKKQRERCADAECRDCSGPNYERDCTCSIRDAILGAEITE